MVCGARGSRQPFSAAGNVLSANPAVAGGVQPSQYCVARAPARGLETACLLTPAPAPQYGIKKKEEREAEAQAAMEANSEGSLTRPKKAIPPGCGDEPEEEDESILDTVIKYLPGPLQDMFKK